MVPIRPFISKSSRPLIYPSMTVKNAPITISFAVTFMFHSFSSSLARSRYWSLFSFSLIFRYSYYYYFTYLRVFSHQHELMVFQWSLSDCQSPQVSRNLQVDLNNAVVWMVTTRHLISKSFRPFINPLMTVPSVPITIGITVTFKFHSFFSYLACSRYLSLSSLSFSFTQWSAGTAKSTIRQVLSLFFLTIPRSRRLAEIKWCVCISKFLSSLCISFSRRFLGCACAISLNGQISIFCTIPSRPPCPPSRVLSYTLFVLHYCIRLWYDWSFLYHYITYICYFVVSCLFLLWRH